MEFSEHIAHGYFFLKNYIIKRGFANEIDWQEEIRLDNLTAKTFLEELSWVILSSGMNEKIINKLFPHLKQTLFGFEICQIAEQKISCYNNCIKIFNHPGKINAILYAAEHLSIHSFDSVMKRLKTDGINYLLEFPYLGNATAYHFAKNIGINVAKPDRHLIRIANALGYDNPHQLCSDISNSIDEKVSLIDLVLWRYATIDKYYLEKILWYKSKQTTTDTN
ncbi:hypothetical protein FUA48_05820 [Flavobacterium alkalisoli]|uniref:DNA lyase n=1 Tax=Flavobacterium alkalisoli TaxID=2602769 RepID=A0A5B9FQ64_9FLAO|nr:hypothetical protein [Flavobacterium alkalisoli]QEE49114.1 hypothetical protein FUA48_05820 [Flavobacterium alkalisoli]